MYYGMKGACRRGHELEGVVIAELTRRGMAVKDQQRTVAWRVLPRLRIQGSLDGTTYYRGAMAVVEVKTRNDERYKITQDYGPEGIPSMLIQGFSYATALGYPGVLFCTAKRHIDHEKVADSVILHYREVPSFFKTWMVARMARLVRYSAEGFPECEGDDLWCPFRGCPGGHGRGLTRRKERRSRFAQRVSAFRDSP